MRSATAVTATAVSRPVRAGAEIFRLGQGSDVAGVTGARHLADAQKRFERMVEAFAADLFRYAVWLCRDRQLADDLVQETFLRAWRSFDSLREPERARSWLITTLRRENARLHERRRLEIAEVEPDDLRGHSPDEADVLSLRAALAALDPMYREPLVLQVLYGHSCDEIGVMLGLPRATVITRVYRARQKLRATLEESGPRRLRAVEKGS